MSFWNYVWGDGIQAPMSILQGFGALLTGVSAMLAYRQYRNKHYGLSDGEWDILKALQKYRVDSSSAKIEAYLHDKMFGEKLNEYRTRRAGDIILKAELPSGGDPSERYWEDVESTALRTSPNYARYCNDLVDRGHLRKPEDNSNVKCYELTDRGERLMREKRNTIESRFFVCAFINEVEEMQDDLRSWHQLQPGTVIPTFLTCSPSSVIGAEFPAEPDDNPCNVRCFIAAPVRREDVESRIGHTVHLELRRATHHLAAHGQDDMILARLVYVKDRRDGLCEMWFDDPSDFLEMKQKKIEDTYYPNSSNRAELPVSYMRLRSRENRELRRKRVEWLHYRHEGPMARFRRKARDICTKTGGILLSVWRKLRPA